MATKKKSNAKAKLASPLKGRRMPGSMTEQIDNLDVGMSISLSERLDLETETVNAEEITRWLKKLRSHMGSVLDRVIDELDTREFKVESGTFLTDDKTGIICIVNVCRMA